MLNVYFFRAVIDSRLSALLNGGVALGESSEEIQRLIVRSVVIMKALNRRTPSSDES